MCEWTAVDQAHQSVYGQVLDRCHDRDLQNSGELAPYQQFRLAKLAPGDKLHVLLDWQPIDQAGHEGRYRGELFGRVELITDELGRERSAISLIRPLELQNGETIPQQEIIQPEGTVAFEEGEPYIDQESRGVVAAGEPLGIIYRQGLYVAGNVNTLTVNFTRSIYGK